MLASLLKRLLRPARHAPPLPPDLPAAGADWKERALELRAAARYREMESLCRDRLTQQSDDADALSLLGTALLALGDGRQGAACLRRVAELQPASASAWLNAGAVLAAVGDAENAIACYRRALTLQPPANGAPVALATLLKALNRYDEAERCCRDAIDQGYASTALRQLLAAALFEQGRVDEAIACIREALALDAAPYAVHSDLLRMLNYAAAQDPIAVAAEHRAWGARHARALELAAPRHANAPDPKRRLRIGYVSPYFRKHAVSFFLEAVIAHHDRARFEVLLYADVERPDEYSRRLQAHGALWRDTVRASDKALARMVRADAVDILVDLSGHTPRNRLLAFARRPAPVQVTWNGYPNTTGMQGMDYRITDELCDPPGATEHLHSEHLMRLPQIYMAWQPPEDAPDCGPLPALSRGHTTFGSFNSCYKLSPHIIGLWSQLLTCVPDSRLLLLTIDGESARRRIATLFDRHGVDASRIEMRGRVTHEEFLTMHREVDIALDPFPYHGTTTTCFSLWMGVPVVTLAGQVHAARVGVSLLTNLGMPQWIAQDPARYVDVAAGLARDPQALARVRTELRGMLQRSPLADGISCARNLETAYREMWAAWYRSRGG